MVRRSLLASPGSVSSTNIWIYPIINKTLPRIMLPKMPVDVPSAPISAGNGAKGTDECTIGSEKSRERCQGCRRMYPRGRNWQETFPRVQPDVPLEPESTGNGAKGTDGCTLGADKQQKRSQRCWWMYPWSRKAPETMPQVQANVPNAKVALSRNLSIFVFL